MKKNGVRLAAAMALLLFTAVTTQAAEWNFYGNARIGTFYTDTDTAGSSTTTFNEYLHGNSRIGAKVKVSDSLTARFEYGASSGQANIRQLWGQWDFGVGSLLVGQTYTPIYTAYSNQAFDEDLGLEKYGTISAGRQPMIQLSFGNFKIAAVEPKNNSLSGTLVETSTPKLEASYTLEVSNFALNLVAGYNTYEIDNQYDVDSYIVGVGAGFKAGPVYVNGTLFTGQNLGPYGFKNAPDDDPVIAAGSVVDNDSFGGSLCVGYKISDMFTLEAGYGYASAELDLAGLEDDEAQSYYLQAKITLAPGVYIIPEIGVVDNMTDANGAEESETTYYGAKWQISF